jgi:hypothetical protein
VTAQIIDTHARNFGAGMGVVIGVRSWSLRTLANVPTLLGPFFPIEWTPGENVATCRKTGYLCGFMADAGGEHKHGASCGRGIVPCGDTPGPVGGCRCGLHAYQEGSIDWGLALNKVSGVIEGYGRVVLGSRGFRATKARILALFVPPMFAAAPNDRVLGYSETDEPHVRTVPSAASEARMTTWTPELVGGLAERYGVPVFRDFDVMVREFPPDPPRKFGKEVA